MVWPDGNENWSGGSSVAQQCGSIWQGRRRPVNRFRTMKSKMLEHRSRPGRAQGKKTTLAPEQQNGQTHRVPEPPVTGAGGADDVSPHPPGSFPIVRQAHQTVVAS